MCVDGVFFPGAKKWEEEKEEEEEEEEASSPVKLAKTTQRMQKM